MAFWTCPLDTPSRCKSTAADLKAYASAAGPCGFVITGGKYLGGSGTKMLSQSQKMDAKYHQNGGLGAVRVGLVAYWGHLVVSRGPRRVPRSFF